VDVSVHRCTREGLVAVCSRHVGGVRSKTADNRPGLLEMARVISIHEYDLKPGADVAVFERAIRDTERRGLFALAAKSSLAIAIVQTV
jgi:hypothetical protein